MEKPHYNQPITAENLRTAMDFYFPEPQYAKSRITSFEPPCRTLVTHLENTEYNYPPPTMDVIERLCEAAKPHILTIMAQDKPHIQNYVLSVILLANYPSLSPTSLIKSNSPGIDAFEYKAKKLREMILAV